MKALVVSLAAVVFYLAAAGRFAVSVFRAQSDTLPAKIQLIGLGLVAIALHAVILYQTTITETGINLGISNAASLVAWLIALFLLVTSIYRPLENLAVILLPIAALSLALQYLFPTEHMLPQTASIGLQVHIMLSVLAYSLLSIAALQAIVLAVADRQLRNRRPIRVMQLVPPLQTMEDLLFQLIRIGFFLLSLSLVSGLMFVENIFAQHLVHKTVLSIFAWLVFAILLWGRRQFGWRGRTAIRCTVGGMIVLLLAYFGSKTVLEVILDRV
jgi:ABC-type uncharacterized transport system permease subunit